MEKKKGKEKNKKRERTTNFSHPLCPLPPPPSLPLLLPSPSSAGNHDAGVSIGDNVCHVSMGNFARKYDGFLDWLEIEGIKIVGCCGLGD